MSLLAYWSYHGMSSLFQSLGASQPAYDDARSVFAAAAAMVISAGKVSIPLAVLIGVVR